MATSSSPSTGSHLAALMGVHRHNNKQTTSLPGPYSATYSGTSNLASRPPHLRSSVSSDSMRPNSAAKPASSLSADNNEEAASSSTDTRGRGRIRFAPLPDPRRPRSHSTGRDIWFDDDSENHIHINTRDGTEASPSSWSSMNGSIAQSNSLSTSLGDNMEDSLSPGKSPISHRRTSSTLSKLLQPLKLGRSKSRENDKQNSPDSDQANRLSLSTSPSLNHWMNGGEPLARSISTGAGSAEIERQRKEEFRSSGIPLKKSSTQESSELSRSLPQRRILYPSVAQGGKRRSRNGPNGPKVVEPEFVEWTNPSARVGVSKEQAEEEDDGSGMAWIKKRRAERERKAKEEAEAAAAAAKATEADSKPDDGQEQEHTASDSAHAKANSEDTIRMSDNVEGHSQAVPDVVVHGEDLIAKEDRRAASQDSQSTLEAPTADVEASEPLSREMSEDDGSSQEEEEEDDGKLVFPCNISKITTWHISFFVYSDSSSQGEDEPEEDNNDDLTAAEIEEEERLAEEARRTTGGASRELYHSHEHQASTHTFEAPSRGPSGPSSLNLPPFERNLSYSSFKSELPRSIAASHPGDWPFREHVVQPC